MNDQSVSLRRILPSKQCFSDYTFLSILLFYFVSFFKFYFIDLYFSFILFCAILIFLTHDLTPLDDCYISHIDTEFFFSQNARIEAEVKKQQQQKKQTKKKQFYICVPEMPFSFFLSFLFIHSRMIIHSFIYSFIQSLCLIHLFTHSFSFSLSFFFLSFLIHSFIHFMPW